jgi:hypothetical protein
MRTTVTIDDDLLGRVKQLAARSHRSIRSVLEEALRAHLDQQAARTRFREQWPTFVPSTPGLRPGVDLEDRHAIMDLVDGLAPTP